MLKRRTKKAKYAVGGLAAPSQNILAEGGMLDDSGEVVNGTEVPTGSLAEEVADDVPAMLSEGEFVVPADVVRFVGLERLMKMRDKAKEGLERMEEMGQMGNAEEVGNPDQQFSQVDDIAFENDIDSIMGEVDRDSAAMQTQQMFNRGGFVTGTDLSKAVQNPAVDVRYYRHNDGRVMYITHINDKPMTAVPDGFKEVSPEEARQVGKKAEENVGAGADGGGATGGTGGDGGGGGDSDGGPVGTGPMGPTGWADLSLNAAKVAETLAKSPVPAHKAYAKAIDFGSMKAADIAFAQTQEGFEAMQAAAAVPGIMSVSGNQGQITTVSTPQSIAAADAAMFAPTPMESLNEAIAASPQATEAANTGMATNAAGQTVSNTATVAAQDAATFGGVSTGIGVGDVSEAAATGMTSVDGVSVSNDATVAAQDAANFGADAASDSGGGDGGCCFIMLEARYGDGTMDNVVRKYRDEMLTDRNRSGYYKLANVFVPLMRKSPTFKLLVQLTFADPLVSYGKWYYKQNRYGWIFAPVKTMWMKLFDIIGADTEFIREKTSQFDK